MAYWNRPPVLINPNAGEKMGIGQYSYLEDYDAYVAGVGAVENASFALGSDYSFPQWGFQSNISNFAPLYPLLCSAFLANVAGREWIFPASWFMKGTATKLGLYVSSAIASSSVIIGQYRTKNGSIYPNERVGRYTIDTSSTGYQYVDLTTNIRHGEPFVFTVWFSDAITTLVGGQQITYGQMFTVGLSTSGSQLNAMYRNTVTSANAAPNDITSATWNPTNSTLVPTVVGAL